MEFCHPGVLHATTVERRVPGGLSRGWRGHVCILPAARTSAPIRIVTLRGDLQVQDGILRWIPRRCSRHMQKSCFRFILRRLPRNQRPPFMQACRSTWTSFDGLPSRFRSLVFVWSTWKSILAAPRARACTSLTDPAGPFQESLGCARLRSSELSQQGRRWC